MHIYWVTTIGHMENGIECKAIGCYLTTFPTQQQQQKESYRIAGYFTVETRKFAAVAVAADSKMYEWIRTVWKYKRCFDAKILPTPSMGTAIV